MMMVASGAKSHSRPSSAAAARVVFLLGFLAAQTAPAWSFTLAGPSVARHVLVPRFPSKHTTSVRRRCVAAFASKRTNVVPSLSEKRWWGRLEELQEYAAKHDGSYNVPRSCPKEYKQLEAWTRTQRYQYRRYQGGKQSLLNEERIAAMAAIGFNWDPYADKWEMRYEELVEYKDMHGNCNLPKSSKKYGRLKTWVAMQRNNYRLLQNGTKSGLTAERIAKLEYIGFSWDPLAAKWEVRFEELREYKMSHGNCDVPQKSKTHHQLSIWVRQQRHQYQLLQKGQPSTMSSEKIRKLDGIGFSWRLIIRPVWKTRLQELVEYKERHGHCNVPLTSKEYPQLGMWVSTQRQAYHYRQNGKSLRMTDERIKALESIGFKWTTDGSKVWDKAWETRFDQLVAFKASHGHFRVPRESKEYAGLGIWAGNQRATYRKSKLSSGRVSKLEGIGFDLGKQQQGRRGSDR